MNERIAIVAGGTGLVGGLLVDELLARQEWARVLLVGRRKTGREHPKLEERLAVIAARSLRPLLAPLAVRPIEARTVARALIAMADSAQAGAHAYSNAELHALGA